MTIHDYSLTEDEQVEAAHASTENHVAKVCATLGWSRRAMIQHLIAFAENDEECPTLAAIFVPAPSRKRKSKRAELVGART